MWCNHAEVEMSAQSFVATHQGLVLSARRLGSSVKESTSQLGLQTECGVTLADKQGKSLVCRLLQRGELGWT